MSSLVRLIMTVDARYHLLLTIPICVEVYSSVYYRVFFIERSKVICYKRLKISLSHVVFGLRREVTMGHLMSDHFKMHF